MPEAAAAPVTPQPPAVQTFLAFDFGTRRIGVASGNTLLKQAQGRGHLRVDAGSRTHFEDIARLIAEWLPAALVVGVPWHPDGAAHENTARARRFARQLHGRFRLPVHEVDERYSTTEALASGGHAARFDADAASAAIILTQFLNPLPAVVNDDAAHAAT
jgi:putative holliday junction resolvase